MNKTDIFSPPRDITCCFTGHRVVPYKKRALIRDRTELEVAWLITHGVTHFVTGGALGYDTIAALSVLRAKKKHHEVKLHLFFPSPTQSARWSDTDRLIYNRIRELADSVLITGTNNTASSMFHRNEAMVNASSYCIAYYDPETQTDPLHPHGGTYTTLEFAKKHGLSITNVNDPHPLELATHADYF